MDTDESRPVVRRPRKVARAALPAGPARELREVVYRLYAEADYPRLDELATAIADDDDLAGAPKKDLISKIIGGSGSASQQDTVSVAVALARLAARTDVAAVARQVRALWLTAQTTSHPVAAGRLGRPIADCDPLALEVHPAIDVPGLDQSHSQLPAYVLRTHDGQLRHVAEAVMGGSSRLVTLVGGSSTGKTRACWELVQYLEYRQPGRWRLWHPYDPTRPEAAVAALDQIGPDTIVWLNEAQFYLAPPDASLGERIAAGLRTLLQDQRRTPVLVLATLWPQHWSALTTRPDPYAQARDLLTGTTITVADGFTSAEVAGLDAVGVDPRLRQAAAQAEGGRITQYLAGAPEQEGRYRTAPPAARAIIQVAMDARRLGHPLALPRSLLEHAAPGYLDDHDWDILGEDWLEQALAYVAQPCKGARGPLTPIRTRPGDPTPIGGPCYRLADYLEQTGRAERAGIYPPDSLWTALTTITDHDLLRELGGQAETRGRYQHAITLYALASDCGDTAALRDLARLRGRAGDQAGAEELYRQAADGGDTEVLRVLVELREKAGDCAGAEVLAVRAADRGDFGPLRTLACLREEAGDRAGAEALAVRAADRGNTDALWDLSLMREQAGAEELCQKAANCGDIRALMVLAGLRKMSGDYVSAGDLYQKAVDRRVARAMLELAQLREEAGDSAGAQELYRQAADGGDTEVLRVLVELREKAGDRAGAEVLAVRAANRGDFGPLRTLACLREEAGDRAGAEALAVRAADRGNTRVLLDLALMREKAGDSAGVEALCQQAADRDDAFAMGALAELREKAGDCAGAEVLAVRAADRGDTRGLEHLIRLRKKAGNRAGVETLYQQAADRGHAWAMGMLARLRVRAGDQAGAEALYRQAVDHGGIRSLWDLAELREEGGDPAGADRTRRFGLTWTGEVTTVLDFGSYGGLVSA